MFSLWQVLPPVPGISTWRERRKPRRISGNPVYPPTTSPNSLEPASGHYHLYQNYPLVPFLSQMNPVFIVMSYFSKIHSSRIHLCLPRDVFASGFRAGILYLFFSLLCIRPSPHPWVDHRSCVCWRAQSMECPVVFVSSILLAPFLPTFIHITH